MFMCIECSLSDDPSQYAQYGNYMVRGTALCLKHAKEANETSEVRRSGPEVFFDNGAEDAPSIIGSATVVGETKARSDTNARRQSPRHRN